MLGVFVYRVVWVGLWVLRHIWWNWTISGQAHLRPRGRAMILAVNHLHWTDTCVLGASLPLSLQPTWLAKAELFANPVAAWWLRAIQVIPVKRGRQGLSALVAAEEALTRGAALIIFVEGHRSATGALQEGQGGAVRLAARCGCPVVPIAVWGTEAGLSGICLRKPIRVSIGEPYMVSTDGPKISQQRMAELTDELEDQVIAELMNAVRRDSNKLDCAMYLIDVAHTLERLADRTTNIAERVIFIATNVTEELNS